MVRPFASSSFLGCERSDAFRASMPCAPRSRPTWRPPAGVSDPIPLLPAPSVIKCRLSVDDTKVFWNPPWGVISGTRRLEAPDAANCRPQEELDRAVQDARGRHRVARGPDRAPHRAHQRTDRAFQGPREGPPLAPGAADADRKAAGTPGISEE